MTAQHLEKKFSTFSRYHYHITINDNRSVFLRFISKKRKDIHISLHRLFLLAPEGIIQAIIGYIEKDSTKALAKLRSYATQRLMQIDYSQKLNTKKLKPHGQYYNLQTVFQTLNEVFFQGKLSLHITWFTKPIYHKRRSCTFGSYERSLQLIKINEVLDSSLCPSYFIYYVVYHEMLHHICPMYFDSAGRRCVHTKYFKERERQFPFFAQAKKWEKYFLQRFSSIARK